MTDFESSESRRGSFVVVCSDKSRNGKTLFSKLVAGLHRLGHGAAPYIFDTDAPDGSLLNHFPNGGRIVDIARVSDQVALFDGVLSRPDGDYLVDLEARHFKRFFAIIDDIGFESAAIDAGLDITIYYLIDRNAASIRAAADLNARLPKSDFVAVRNPAFGDALAERNIADIYRSMRLRREFLLPEVSADTLGMIEHPDFEFDAFLAGRYEHFPFELKSELWTYMEGLYEQRGRSAYGDNAPL